MKEYNCLNPMFRSLVRSVRGIESTIWPDLAGTTWTTWTTWAIPGWWIRRARPFLHLKIFHLHTSVSSIFSSTSFDKISVWRHSRGALDNKQYFHLVLSSCSFFYKTTCSNDTHILGHLNIYDSGRHYIKIILVLQSKEERHIIKITILLCSPIAI